jgi:hypothetical protein
VLSAAPLFLAVPFVFKFQTVHFRNAGLRKSKRRDHFSKTSNRAICGTWVLKIVVLKIVLTGEGADQIWWFDSRLQ